MITLNKVRGAVFGAAAGDAVGVPYEFEYRESMQARPATDMVGHGTYHMPSGTWSDDTSMILCTLDKLDASVDYSAIMSAFTAWNSKGEYTPFGKCFDIGITTSLALTNYRKGIDPLNCGLDDERSNGNGSLMRIIPAALYIAAHGLSAREGMQLVHNLSALTHAHMRSKIGCGIFIQIALELIKNNEKSSVLNGIKNAAEFYSGSDYKSEISYYERIFRDDFAELAIDEIRSSGYVVDTLECAVWSLMNTGNYRDCVLKAVNFGADTDTAACVAGALAGLLYGIDGIPSEWMKKLRRSEFIEEIVEGFCRRNAIK
ncbi:MAG: ADP-ribosylglycohydrolase family protein [Acutalibacteraceae bacterium]